MKIVCISNTLTHGTEEVKGVTIDKVYTVHQEDDNGYKIVNDNGELGFYWKGRFRPLDDVRRDKLKDLLGL